MKKTESHFDIGNKLRKLRLNKGYSQEYMAEKLHVCQKTYSNMENEKATISIDTLRKIAEELEVDLLELLTDGKVVVQYNNSHDSSTFNGVVNHNLSEDFIENYKNIINDYKLVIEELKKQIVIKDNIINKLSKE